VPAAFTDIDDYISSLPPDVQTVLQELRRRVHAAAPGVQETIRYDIPTFTLHGIAIVHIAGWKKHVSIYPLPVCDEDTERELAQYRSGASTAKFPLAQPVPYDLVQRCAALLATQRGTRHAP